MALTEPPSSATRSPGPTVAPSSMKGRSRTPSRAKAPRQAGGSGPLVRGQVGVPRRHGYSVRLANDRAPDDLHGERQVADQSPDESQLLGVLLAEVRGPATGQVEELRDYRQHAPE